MRDIVPSLLREIDRNLKLYLAFLMTRLPGKAEAIRDEGCWLIGGTSGMRYSGNSAALHLYLVEHHPELKVYWVSNRDSPDVAWVRQIGPVLHREEVRTYVYGLLARVHVISHGLADVPTCGSSLSKGAVKVRLGHGLTALKRPKGSPLRSVRAKNRLFDLVPLSSEFERQHKLTWGIDPDKLVVTGLPRFDELVRRAEGYQGREGAEDMPKRILYMPTWRDWLPRHEGRFRETAFYREVRAFLRHPDLETLLAQHGAVLDVHLHVLMRRHTAVMAGEVAGLTRVRVLPPEADLQEALAQSRLLITDYSSVAWDFLYLDRPVLFFQFDVETFQAHLGAHVDLNDLFGPVARDANEAVALMEQFLARDFDTATFRVRMDEWQRKAFCYRDTRNCERVAEAILARLDG